MISRQALLFVEWIGGVGCLMLGCAGQAAFIKPLAEGRLPAMAVVAFCMVPFLVVFTITYTKQSLLSPRAFRFCLLLVMAWFAVGTIGAEAAWLAGFMPKDGQKNDGTFIRVLMHVGWLSFVPIIRLYLAVRRNELHGSPFRPAYL